MLEPYYQDKYATVLLGDSRVVLHGLEEKATAVVTDPPYELAFMGKSWDSQGVSFQKVTWQIIRDYCLPGAPMLSFGGTRTQHRIACAIEDAGWELRDCIMWVYGTGFPKSMDVSKAIDKAVGAERELVGTKVGQPGYSLKHQGVGGVLDGRADGSLDNSEGECAITAPATPEAQLWNGWGTALKPAYEPIILAMNPLDGTFAQNALAHGVAGLNIDECRVPGQPPKATGQGFKNQSWRGVEGRSDIDGRTLSWVRPSGRFPANLIHDGSEEVLELFPDSKSTGGQSSLGAFRNGDVYGKGLDIREKRNPGLGDDGSAARFFYTAKASRSERGDGNKHPTVKPLSLMEYLCKLVKMPEKNLILDPFCGSGSTLVACTRLGISSIGIDSDEDSCRIAAERCAQAASERLQRGEY